MKNTKTRCPTWQVTKTTTKIKHPDSGVEMEWCPHHKSKDGSVNGIYMPSPHDHDAWKEKKAQYANGSNHRGKRERDTATAKVNPKRGDGGKSLKLALNQKLTTALVTQHHLSQNEADALFNSCYTEADEASN